MDINLPLLRAEWLKNPLLKEMLRLCAEGRRSELTTLAWCEENLHRGGGAQSFKEVLLVFRTLESAGFGRILQPSQRARARFQWAVVPFVIDAMLRNPQASLSSTDLLPAAAELGFTLPSEGPERAGWTRHVLTLRPNQTAEMFLPDDLTRREAEWLADFFLRLAGK